MSEIPPANNFFQWIAASLMTILIGGGSWWMTFMARQLGRTQTTTQENTQRIAKVEAYTSATGERIERIENTTTRLEEKMDVFILELRRKE